MHAVTGTVRAEIEDLHGRCGVYTKPAVVERILDAVGWWSGRNLSQARLLEPAAGDGAFVIEAGRRLVASYARHGIEPKADLLRDRISAFEIHPREAARARSNITRSLVAAGIRRRVAQACARSWIITGDFLLATLPGDGFTHVVGNPPYVRWSKIPSRLRARYEREDGLRVKGGDLFLPFLDRGLEALRPKGRCGFLCSDRWRFMAFAEKFRKKWMPLLDIAENDPVEATEAFVRSVDSYPTVLIASKRSQPKVTSFTPAASSKKTLAELGCTIKVGPALGHAPAFVLDTDESDVESELLLPWLDSSEISEDGDIAWRGRRVVAMHDDDGRLVDPERFPLLLARLGRFRASLEQRSIVRNGAPWFRTIDRVRAVDWKRPKLLIPELARVPRASLDRSEMVPSHAVYAIFARDDDVERLSLRLDGGRLARLLEGIAPQVKGGYTRCYKRILEQVRI